MKMIKESLWLKVNELNIDNKANSKSLHSLSLISSNEYKIKKE